jgi:hypothetical protein
MAVNEENDRWMHSVHMYLPENGPEANYEVSTSNNKSVQLFIIYVPSQQLQGQLQTQHSVDIGNIITFRTNTT